MSDDFADFLRGRETVETTVSKVEPIGLGNGYEQFIDRWGRTKKRFDISIPLSTEDEIEEYQDFFDDYYDSNFYFTNPRDSVKYTVRFLNPEFAITRLAPDTYVGNVTLQEVF